MGKKVVEESDVDMINECYKNECVPAAVERLSKCCKKDCRKARKQESRSQRASRAKAKAKEPQSSTKRVYILCLSNKKRRKNRLKIQAQTKPTRRKTHVSPLTSHLRPAPSRACPPPLLHHCPPPQPIVKARCVALSTFPLHTIWLTVADHARIRDEFALQAGTVDTKRSAARARDKACFMFSQHDQYSSHVSIPTPCMS